MLIHYFFWKFHSTGRTAPQGVWYERTFTLKSDSFISYLRTSYGTSVVLQSIYAMAERSDRGDTVFEDTEAKSIRVHSRNHYPRESEGMFSPALVCLSVCVCLTVTTITKKIVDGFAPNFMRKFLGGKGRPSSCSVTIGSGMLK